MNRTLGHPRLRRRGRAVGFATSDVLVLGGVAFLAHGDGAWMWFPVFLFVDVLGHTLSAGVGR